MRLADEQVAELYNSSRIMGEEPKYRSEENFMRIENPYSLSNEGPGSMFKQAGGSRRKTRRTRRSRKSTRRNRRHH
jgi:hypothetical protein